LGEGRWSRVLVNEAILHAGLEPFVELAGEGLVVPLNETLDAVELSEVGRDRGGLVEVAKFSLLGAHDIRVSKCLLQGLGELGEGFEFGWDLRASHRGFRVLIQERLEPVESRSVEVTGGKEDLLGLVGEEFGAAEEVVAALREEQVELMSVSRV
jgi:hypothetical protein